MIATVPSPNESTAAEFPVNLNVRLSIGQLEDLQAVADHHGVKLSVIVREALRHGLRDADRAIGDAIVDSQSATA